MNVEIRYKRQIHLSGCWNELYLSFIRSKSNSQLVFAHFSLEIEKDGAKEKKSNVKIGKRKSTYTCVHVCATKRWQSNQRAKNEFRLAQYINKNMRKKEVHLLHVTIEYRHKMLVLRRKKIDVSCRKNSVKPTTLCVHICCNRILPDGTCTHTKKRAPKSIPPQNTVNTLWAFFFAFAVIKPSYFRLTEGINLFLLCAFWLWPAIYTDLFCTHSYLCSSIFFSRVRRVLKCRISCSVR